MSMIPNAPSLIPHEISPEAWELFNIINRPSLPPSNLPDYNPYTFQDISFNDFSQQTDAELEPRRQIASTILAQTQTENNLINEQQRLKNENDRLNKLLVDIGEEQEVVLNDFYKNLSFENERLKKEGPAQAAIASEYVTKALKAKQQAQMKTILTHFDFNNIPEEIDEDEFTNIMNQLGTVQTLLRDERQGALDYINSQKLKEVKNKETMTNLNPNMKNIGTDPIPNDIIMTEPSFDQSTQTFQPNTEQTTQTFSKILKNTNVQTEKFT